MRSASVVCIGVLAGLGSAGPARGQEGRAVGVYARGDYAAVVKLLEPDYRQGKAKIQDRILLARAYLHLRRDRDARAVLESVLKSDSENPEANTLMGTLLHKAGKYADAVDYLKHSLRLKPDPAAAGMLGKCHYALGRPAKAKSYLEKALKQDIRDPSNSFLLGKICLARGLGALAEKYLLMAQEAGMDSQELHLLLGRAYLLQRKLTGPILVRQLAGPASPGRIAQGHVVLGKLPGQTDRYKVCTPYSALYEGCHLLQSDARNKEALFMAAAGWFAAGDVGRAEKHLKRLLAHEPDSRRVLDLQARVLIARKDFANLAKHLSGAQAKKVFGDEEAAGFYYRAALALRGGGKRAQAIGMLKKAEHRLPASAKVLRALAGLCRATGRLKEARGYYARMVELFPDAPDIDELRNVLKVLQAKTGAKQ